MAQQTPRGGGLAASVGMTDTVPSPLDPRLTGADPSGRGNNPGLPQAPSSWTRSCDSPLLAKGGKKTEARIKKPKDDKLASGEVEIEGTATCPDFSGYTLSFAPEGDPDNWTTIGEYSQPVDKGLLGTWDTRTLADGTYHLKLTVFSTSGPAAQHEIRVGVDNSPPTVSISSPQDGGVVVSPFDITGTAADAFLKQWRLESRSASPLLLAHLDGSTVNERDGEEGEITGEPAYREAKFAQGLYLGAGEGLTYPSRNNIGADAGTIQMWVIPDWGADDTETHVLLYTETEDPEY